MKVIGSKGLVLTAQNCASPVSYAQSLVNNVFTIDSSSQDEDSNEIPII